MSATPCSASPSSTFSALTTFSPTAEPPPCRASGPQLARRAAALRSSDVRDLLRDAQSPGMLSLAGGLPAAELFDLDGLRAATEAAMADDPSGCLQYGQTEGLPALRAALAAHLNAAGEPCDIDQLMITTGSQQALDLIARLLIDDGDRVALEAPTYLAALQCLSLQAPRFISIQGDDQGLCVDALHALPADQTPKLVYVVSNFANPTGTTLSLQRRHALLAWAAERQCFILEDDPYGALRTRGERLPSLWSLAQANPALRGWVGATSTFSKTVAPGLRVGWLLLPPHLLAAAARIKQATDLHTASLPQQILLRYLQQTGRIDQRLQLIRAHYAARSEALLTALQQHFGARLQVNQPEGGMFVWARFTDGTPTRALLPLAKAQGMIFVPGDAFYAQNTDGSSCANPGTLRLSFTSGAPEQLAQGVRRLAAAHQQWHAQAAPIAPSRVN